jgi:RNA polymerase sigma factor (sigma-70 family)
VEISLIFPVRIAQLPMNSESNDLRFDNFWTAFKQGDKAAFEHIYREHISALLAYGYKVTSDRSLIEDSIQDLFVELWQSRERISETTSIKFYLFKALRYKIVRNLSQHDFIDFLDIEISSEVEPVLPQEHFTIGIEVQSEQMSHLKNSISQLPRRQQEAINLRYFQNFSNEEVAKIMGVNYQSACKFIYSALRKLKLNLKVAVSSFLFFINFF